MISPTNAAAKGSVRNRYAYAYSTYGRAGLENHSSLRLVFIHIPTALVWEPLSGNFIPSPQGRLLALIDLVGGSNTRLTTYTTTGLNSRTAQRFYISVKETTLWSRLSELTHLSLAYTNHVYPELPGWGAAFGADFGNAFDG